MVNAHRLFKERLHRLARKHHAMGKGYVMRLMPDGLMVPEPVRLRIELPYRVTTLLIVALLVFKGFLIASLGTQPYQDRLFTLDGGTLVEQAGAWIMQPDRISVFIADRISLVLQ
ncbi:MAG: hypothetical protein ABJI96_19590 [Paracoccaceae bacterium]